MLHIAQLKLNFYITENTPLKVKTFCGADGVDFWDEHKWQGAIDEHHVLVFIPQVFLDYSEVFL